MGRCGAGQPGCRAGCPPANLTEIMEEEGWIILTHEPDPETVLPFTHEENVAWLRRMTEEYRQIYLEVRRTGPGA